MINAGRNGIATRLDVVVQIDSDSRLLAKLGLAVGYKTFGARFLATDYAKTLRSALWEPNLEKRRSLPVRGTGYLHGPLPPGGIGSILKWLGAWVLIMRRSGELLDLTVIAPSSIGRLNAWLAPRNQPGSSSQECRGPAASRRAPGKFAAYRSVLC
jgi:hypothetical protein